MELIPRLKEIWITKKDEVIKSANEIASSLNNQNLISDTTVIDKSVLDKAYDELSKDMMKQMADLAALPNFRHRIIYYSSCDIGKAGINQKHLRWLKRP